MKALLYRRGGLGDTLLTFPVLEVLKTKGYRVTAVGNTDYFAIAKEVGWADEIRSYLRDGESYDLEVVISIDGNLKPFPEGRVWLPKYYLDSLGFGDHSFSDTLPLKGKGSLPLSGKAVLHPSSGSPKKNPPLDMFLEVESFLKERGIEVMYLIGEADGWLKGMVSPYVESLNPLEIAKGLKEALLFVGLDSGVSHLASYCGVPSVVIYGPTDEVVWRPIGREVYQVKLPYDCSPCFPNVCEERPCLYSSRLLEEVLPLLDHLLIKVNKDNLP